MIDGNGKNLRIAMLSVHSSPLGDMGSQDTGGMSVYVREMAGELGRRGHRVDIYTRSEEGKIHQELTLSENVQLIHLDTGGSKPIPKNSLYPYLPDFFQALETCRIQKGLDYDLVHSHYWLSGRVGCMAQRCWNVPHIIMFHTTGMAKRVYCNDEKETHHRLIAEKKLAHECDRVIVATEREKILLRKYYALHNEKIGLASCGVNLDTFRPLSKDEARNKLGLQKLRNVILYVGRFAPVKGMDRLMAAMTYMKQKDVKLLIVGGDGPQAQSTATLKHYARKLRIHNNVVFAGRVRHEDLFLYYNAADVLAVPSYYESFGLVALESLACGTPVVATRVGAMDALVQCGITGDIVNMPSPGGIAHALENVIKQQKRGAFSPRAIRASVAELGWERIASAVLREYAIVLESKDSLRMNSEKSVEVTCGFSC